jgi:hypothetical protein
LYFAVLGKTVMLWVPLGKVDADTILTWRVGWVCEQGAYGAASAASATASAAASAAAYGTLPPTWISKTAKGLESRDQRDVSKTTSLQ